MSDVHDVNKSLCMLMHFLSIETVIRVLAICYLDYLITIYTT